MPQNGKRDPRQQADRETHVYTGEKGARQTKQDLAWNKTPEEVHKQNLEESRDIASRTAYIAGGYTEKTDWSKEVKNSNKVRQAEYRRKYGGAPK